MFPVAPKVRKTYELAHVSVSALSAQNSSDTDDIGTSWASCLFPVRSPDQRSQSPAQALSAVARWWGSD
jgi:hypothetical protein